MKIIKIMWKILKVFFTLLGGYVTFSNVWIICSWVKRHGVTESFKHWTDYLATVSGELCNW